MCNLGKSQYHFCIMVEQKRNIIEIEIFVIDNIQDHLKMNII